MPIADRSRRAFTLAACGVMAGGLSPQLAAQPVRGTHRLSLALAARHSLYHLPLTLADQLGYFQQLGLSIDWQAYESGAKALASVTAGHADVFAGAFDHVFGLHDRGLNFQSFVQMARTPQVSLGVATRRDWRSVMELKGARIGVTALESSTHWMACQWLLQNGLLPEDVVFVEVGSSLQVVDALRQGRIDALCNPDPVMHWLELRNELRILGEARTLTATRKVLGGPVPGACLLARADFLQKQAPLVQSLTDAVVHALKWLQTAGLTDVLKTVPPAYWMGDRAAYLGAFEKLRESYAVDGVMSPDAVRYALLAHSRLPGAARLSKIPMARLYTNGFALRAKDRFEA